MEKIGEAVIGS